jgi:hypothetical protein
MSHRDVPDRSSAGKPSLLMGTGGRLFRDSERQQQPLRDYTDGQKVPEAGSVVTLGQAWPPLPVVVQLPEADRGAQSST